MHGAKLTFGAFVHGTFLAVQIKQAEGHKNDIMAASDGA